MAILQFNFSVVTVKYLCNGRCRITINHFLVLVLATLCCLCNAIAMFCLHCKHFTIRIHTAFKQIDTKFKLKYAFSEFVTPSCKWGKVACLQCKSYKFGPLVWGTTCNLIPHVCLFLITRPLVHHKNKSNSLETRLWKDISHQTLRSNSYGKI